MQSIAWREVYMQFDAGWGPRLLSALLDKGCVALVCSGENSWLQSPLLGEKYGDSLNQVESQMVKVTSFTGMPSVLVVWRQTF